MRRNLAAFLLAPLLAGTAAAQGELGADVPSRRWPSETHRCVHDRVSEVAHDHRSARAHRSAAAVSSRRPNHAAAPLGDDAAAGGTATFPVRAGGVGPGQPQQRQQGAGTTPATLLKGNTDALQIKFRFLTGTTLDPGYACGAAGDEVLIGTSATASQTCSTETPDSATCSFRCTADDVLTAAKLDYLTRSLEETAAFFAAILRVGREGGSKLTVPSPGVRCGAGSYGIEIPQDDLNNGFENTTYVMYVTARPVLGTTLAFASACAGQFESVRGRPVIGYINFSPSQVVVGDPGLDTIARHETTHALGFSFSLFSRFNPPQAANADDKIADEVPATRNGEPVQVPYMVSPRVRAEARRHFKCDDLPGAELEGGGGTGTRLSHWEQRIFGVEYMVGTKSASPIYSRLTMALFEDTGWYFVDTLSPRISTINPWGSELGCEFAMGSCVGTAWKSQGSPYFCDSGDIEGCSISHIGTAVCDISTFQDNLPPQFQHYPGAPKRGGTNALMDYCPVLSIARLCNDAEDGKVDPALYIEGRGEAYGVEPSGASGRCVASTLLDDDVRFRPFRSTRRSFGCYMSRCRAPDEIMVRVKEHWYSCTGRGGVRVSNVYGDMDGEFICPDAAVICQSTVADTTWPRITAVSDGFFLYIILIFFLFHTRTHTHLSLSLSHTHTHTHIRPPLQQVVPDNLDRRAGISVTIHGANMGAVTSVDVSGGPCAVSTTTALTATCVTGDEGYSTTEDFVRVSNAQGLGDTTDRGSVSVDGDFIGT
jgi:leishmanolysin-like peptidase